MKPGLKLLLIFFISGLSFKGFSQVPDVSQFRPDPEKERMYAPYLAVWHGGDAAMQEWKKTNTVQYYKELWYFTESFYIRRDYFTEGGRLNESIIAIDRFDSTRLQDEESIVIVPGHRDVLVLLPASKLLYKPEFHR